MTKKVSQLKLPDPHDTVPIAACCWMGMLPIALKVNIASPRTTYAYQIWMASE